MGRKLSIKGGNAYHNTHVVDSETGDPVEGVMSIDIQIDPMSRTKVTMTFIPETVEVEGHTMTGHAMREMSLIGRYQLSFNQDSRWITLLDFGNVPECCTGELVGGITFEALIQQIIAKTVAEVI